MDGLQYYRKHHDFVENKTKAVNKCNCKQWENLVCRNFFIFWRRVEPKLASKVNVFNLH